MAKVDTDHGWFKIANTLAEGIYRSKLTARELRFIFWLMRNSYGRRGAKSAADPGPRAIGKEMNMDHGDVIRTVARLVKAGILRREAGRFYLIKDYETWVTEEISGGKSPPLVANHHRWQNTTKTVANHHQSGGKLPPHINKVSKDIKDKRHTHADGAGPSIPLLLAEFEAGQSRTIGEPATFNRGAAGAGFKRLLRNHTEAEIRVRMDNWFKSRDPFIERNSWRAEVFFNFFNALKGGPIIREAKDWAAEKKATDQEDKKRREELDARAEQLIRGRNPHRK